ncbi:MAG: hypothetical protein ABI433_17575 [Burkholderiaceae bacterium]
MSHAQPKQYFAAQHRAVAYGGAIEWEELPSLAASLSKRLVTRGSWARDAANTASGFEPSTSFQASQSPWDATMPANLDALQPSEPFRETLNGLSMREVTEPDVFHHFFGGQAEAR